jgi:hypothetical protein
LRELGGIVGDGKGTINGRLPSVQETGGCAQAEVLAEHQQG